MPSATISPNNSETTKPREQSGVADAVRACFEANRAVYTLGGGTAQDYGIAPTLPGQTLDLTGLAKIVDYTPRDMTIVLEAGVRMADLAATLAAEGQHLPIDIPRASEATIGGVVATNWSGPRRYGHGTIRDYVIGVHAVDGRGTPFKGGGRVVKNVAGYDFCKLLTGSLGTLAVITQLALKVKPKSECSATVVGECSDLVVASSAVASLADLEGQPAAIDLLIGAGWGTESPGRSATIVALLEGTESEIVWLKGRVSSMLAGAGATNVREFDKGEAEALWARQIEFPDRGLGGAADKSPMVVKVAVPPSKVASVIAKIQAIDSGCAIQAHAGNGIIIARFSAFRHDDVTKLLVAKLRPVAVRLGGSLVVVKSKLEGLTSHVVWGGRSDATVLVEQIKQQFDPRNILNPGRFAYH